MFRRCVACHTVEKGGSNGIGPNLHGIVGAPVASKPDFSYSGAMKAKGGVWDETALDAYLKAPMKDVPGTRMAFAGVIDATDRQALILYLEEQSTSLRSSLCRRHGEVEVRSAEDGAIMQSSHPSTPLFAGDPPPPPSPT